MKTHTKRHNDNVKKKHEKKQFAKKQSTKNTKGAKHEKNYTEQ